MRWRDVDLEAGWWTIPGEYAKNGRAHRVPLGPHEEGAFANRTRAEDRIPWTRSSPHCRDEDGGGRRASPPHFRSVEPR
jgi:integrase